MTTTEIEKPQRICDRFKQRARERREQVEAELHQLAESEANGAPCDPFHAQQLCASMDWPLEKFEHLVRNAAARTQALETLKSESAAAELRDKFDRELEAENERHRKAVEKIESRRAEPAEQIRQCERAREICTRLMPLALVNAIKAARHEIHESQQVVEAHVGLTDDERDVVRRPVALEGNARVLGDNWVAWPGVDAELAARTIAEVTERQHQFEQAKADARERIELLERRIARLMQLAVRFDVSEQDIADAMADELSEFEEAL